MTLPIPELFSLFIIFRINVELKHCANINMSLLAKSFPLGMYVDGLVSFWFKSESTKLPRVDLFPDNVVFKNSQNNFKQYVNLLHFGLTSQDITTTAYSINLKNFH